MQNSQKVKLAVECLQGLLPRPAVGLVLGSGLSGLGDILDRQKDCQRIPFADVPGFPPLSVTSHAGEFIFGFVGDVPVLMQMGRAHLYEGRTPDEICMGVRVMAGLGARALILTNAAGALNPLFAPGSLMCICDCINHTGLSPLTGANCDEWGERFPDMSEPFAPSLRHAAQTCALGAGLRLEEGVYIGVHGPEMETPAETRMYRQWGADAIGMSTVLEVIAARHCGLSVLGLSCLTNRNLPDCMAPAPFNDVLLQAAKCGEKLARLLPALIPAIAAP